MIVEDQFFKQMRINLDYAIGAFQREQYFEGGVYLGMLEYMFAQLDASQSNEDEK